MKTDSLFYRLFLTDPALALELAGLAVPEPERYRFGSPEVKQTSFRIDGVLEPPADQPDAPMVFVEVQFQPDDGFYLRFLSELLLYLRQYQPLRPWHAVVLYPYATIERLNLLNRPFLALPNLHRIVLTELPLLASPNPKLWLIALILAEETEIAQIVNRVQAHRQQHPSDGIDWVELLETVLVYKLSHFTREEIQDMFGFNDIELKQTRFYQQAVGEGRVEGRVEGEATMLLHLLRLRFGSVPAEVEARVMAANTETLLRWSERLLTATALDAVFAE